MTVSHLQAAFPHPDSRHAIDLVLVSYKPLSEPTSFVPTRVSAMLAGGMHVQSLAFFLTQHTFVEPQAIAFGLE